MYYNEYESLLREEDFFCYCMNNDYSECGCYYLTPEICKDIIINAGAYGDYTPNAVKRLRSKINRSKNVMEDLIPAFRFINHDIISYYSGVLAESLIKAAGNGKGVEIAIGYPKILVISVN